MSWQLQGLWNLHHPAPIARRLRVVRRGYMPSPCLCIQVSSLPRQLAKQFHLIGFYLAILRALHCYCGSSSAPKHVAPVILLEPRLVRPWAAHVCQIRAALFLLSCLMVLFQSLRHLPVCSRSRCRR